jgi:formylglycine-generating enzyme required for sulfatase activity
MKKMLVAYCFTVFAFCFAALVCVWFTGCDYENPVMKEWWDEAGQGGSTVSGGGPGSSSVNIPAPVITEHPKGAVYILGEAADAMTVTASAASGSLSYQWYANGKDNNTGGTAIPGAIETQYTPPTDQRGVIYYYVVVTSTVPGDGGNATARAVSKTAAIEVGVTPVTITGLSAQNKVYDGTTTATVTGTPVLNGVTSGDNVTIVQGAAAFADANAGVNKTVTLDGWSLAGADANSYVLRMPNLTADITKANPTVTWPTGLIAVTGETLSDIPLPGNGTSKPDGTFTWTTPADSVGGLGTQSHNMTFTPNDKVNYNTAAQNVSVTVKNAKVASLIGLMAQDKAYDGTTAVTVTGTPLLSGVAGGDNVTIVAGTFAFADANAGKDKAVVYIGWSLAGADANSYILRLPTLTADIAKINPVVTWPTGLTGLAEKPLSAILLPGNGTGTPAGTFTWTNPADSTGRMGIWYHNMTFTPDDTVNYNPIVQAVKIMFTVIPGTLIKMIAIPAGTFMMGSPDDEPGRGTNEGPQHQVTLTSDFYMGECPVTQDLYKTVMGYTSMSNWTVSPGEIRELVVAGYVSWYDTLVFCNKLSALEGLRPAYRINNSTDLGDWGSTPTVIDAAWDAVEIVPGSNGYRLPTEAQWEYACRAGTKRAYYTGDTFNSDIGWYENNSTNMMHQVGLKLPNPWGLYDMAGNIWEWCWDRYEKYSSGAQIDPTGPLSLPKSSHVTRGGCYFSLYTTIRSAYRGAYAYPCNRSFYNGFRVVRPL